MSDADLLTEIITIVARHRSDPFRIGVEVSAVLERDGKVDPQPIAEDYRDLSPMDPRD